MAQTDNHQTQPYLHPSFVEYILSLGRVITLGRLSSSVLHDIRNQLAVISGSVQIIQLKGDSIPPTELNTRLENVINAVDKISNEMNNLGQYAPRPVASPVAYDLEKVVDDTLKLLNKRLDRSNVKLERSGGGTPFRLFTDAGLLEYAIVEIVSASIQSTPPPATLIVSTFLDDDYWSLDIVAVPQEGQVSSTTSVSSSIMMSILIALAKKIKGRITRLFSGYRISFKTPQNLTEDQPDDQPDN